MSLRENMQYAFRMFSRVSRMVNKNGVVTKKQFDRMKRKTEREMRKLADYIATELKNLEE